MSLQEWADLDEDVDGELVDGLLEEEEMATFLHEIVVMWLARTVGMWARRRRMHLAGSETKIAVGPRRGRKPDLSIYAREQAPALLDTLVRRAPHVVIEVISPRPRDAPRDRVDKARDYARAGVAYYWMIDPQLRTLEILELESPVRYRVAAAGGHGRVRVPGCPALVLNLDELWREIDELAAQQSGATKRSKRTR